MKIQEAGIPGVFLIESERRSDERGYLVRTYCEDTFRGHELNLSWVQTSITSSPINGTLRGMHYQKAPFGEIKLIRCITGSIWDCLVDLRQGSRTFGKWEAFELSEETARSLYVPLGIAHGFLTMTPDVRMHYAMSRAYSSEHASGIRWNDPAVGIAWPNDPVILSERDGSWGDLQDATDPNRKHAAS